LTSASQWSKQEFVQEGGGSGVGGLNTGTDLGLVRPQATVIPRGAATAPYPNYINNFIKMLSNAFRVIVILQPFYYFI